LGISPLKKGRCTFLVIITFPVQPFFALPPDYLASRLMIAISPLPIGGGSLLFYFNFPHCSFFILLLSPLSRGNSLEERQAKGVALYSLKPLSALWAYLPLKGEKLVLHF